MTWWQVLLVFVGIPAGLFALITALVLRFATARIPDGLVRPEEPESQRGEDSEPDGLVRSEGPPPESQRGEEPEPDDKIAQDDP